MVVIRLARHGRKADPVYKIMVSDKNRVPTGRFIEKLGTYYPKNFGAEAVVWNKENYDKWLAKGAIPSDRIKRMVLKLDAGTFQPEPDASKKKLSKKAKAKAAEAAKKPAEEAAPAAEKTEETAEKTES